MERAEEALARVGWRNLEQVRETDFGKLFGFPPRPLQQATADVAHRASSPALVLIEAPMGEGKTEAALHLAEAFASKVGQGGLYVGLPTQATADQMFRRVNAFLQSAHPKQRENLHLVHGSAILSKSYRELKLRAVYGEDDHASVVAEQWFCGPKRALLAAHAVGTIDQALLGVMRVKHGFVRLFGLTGKTVILDEVHAYDTYTSTLLDRLVAWLGALGASVVVLSATLPSSRRAKLLEAFAGRTVDCETPPYPRATVVDATSANSQRFDISRPEQHIAIEWLQDDAGVGATARALLEKVGDGGCAGWICNSVARSQRAFSELLHLRYTGSLPPDTRLLLLHSRFTMRERHERERELGRWLGPNDADRPRAAIIVGTQVLEQSLDVDFDVLASDLAPVDLVLQRAGRLHRHARDLRPERVKQPTLMLVAPAATTDPAPSFGVVARVYDSYIMARTWDVTRSLTVLKLPKNIEALVEAVYAKKPEQKTHRAQSSALARHQRSNAKASSSAAARLLPDPRSSDDPFGNLDMPFDEDSADIAEELRAKTRLGGPSCHVICLHRVHGTKRLEPTSTDVLNLDLQPDRALIQEFLLRSIPINNPELVQLLQAKDPPKSWARVALLRDRRPLLLDHGTASLGRYGVRLDDTLGLVLERSEEG
ncbi:MAG: CRISPR-associated helicase Cas3' [Proteobacteria bacterium]|nr:CRISPR-associated helicase Cas3' [Pseudomonadota bacterium]